MINVSLLVVQFSFTIITLIKKAHSIFLALHIMLSHSLAFLLLLFKLTKCLNFTGSFKLNLIDIHNSGRDLKLRLVMITGQVSFFSSIILIGSLILLFKKTGDSKMWPDKFQFWPDIVQWPAVILSPGTANNVSYNNLLNTLALR